MSVDFHLSDIRKVGVGALGFVIAQENKEEAEPEENGNSLIF